jgi:putative transposase
VAVAVDGANRHDMQLVEATLHALGVEPPQHLCWDKGYDYDAVRATLAAGGYTAHSRQRREEIQAQRALPGSRARRGVVERTHSWMNRFRRVLIRWEKKVENYLAFVHFACAWLAFRAAEVFG